MKPSHRPKRSLGQNFLIDPNYKRKILGAVFAKTGSPILEIGGGKGILSNELAKTATHLWIVEKDRLLAQLLLEKFGDNQKVEVVCEDFLKLNLESDLKLTFHGSTGSPCPGRGRGTVTVVGNLPYNVASQIFIKLMENRQYFSELFLMFQKEMALRFVAKPTTRDYGLLTLWAQIYTEPKILFHLPPTVFYPRPKVSSSFVSFKIRETPLISHEESLHFWKSMRTLFQKRRKTIRSALGKNYPATEREYNDQRAEELTVIELIALARSLPLKT